MAKPIKDESKIIKMYLPTSDELIEEFEESGYLKPSEAKELIDAMYVENVVPIAKDEFVREAFKALEQHKLYKQFLNNEVKMCTNCGDVKPLDSYYPSKDSADKRFAYCKKCNREINRSRYENDASYRESIAKGRRKYYENNKERHREVSRRWREKNKAKHTRYNRLYKLNKRLAIIGAEITFDDLSKVEALKKDHKLSSLLEACYKFGEGLGIKDYEKLEPLVNYRSNPYDRKKIAQQLKDGITCADIAKEYNKHPTTVQKLVRAEGGKDAFIDKYLNEA